MEQNGVGANSKANGSLGGEINMLRKEINELLNSEEIKWR